MLKMIYLARRKPGFSLDDFIRRWRKHGALGMEQPLWRQAVGYVQAEPIRPVPIRGASEDFDAVACFIVRDEMFSEMDDNDVAGAAIMAEDELLTFAEPTLDVCLWVKEEHIRPGALGGITAFLFFEQDAAARECAELASHVPDLHRITLNLRDDAPLGPDIHTLPYQAVVELSTHDVPTLAAALGASEGSPLLSAADLAVVTREAVLWDRLPEAG